MTPLLLLFTALAVLSCTRNDHSSVFPAQANPKVTVRDGYIRAQHWSFEELGRPRSKFEGQFEAPLQTALKGARFSPEYACVARELAAFSARYSALPDDLLQRWIAGRCGAPDVFFYVSQANLFDTGTDFDLPFSGEYVRTVMDILLPARAVLTKASVFGLAVHAVEGGAVAVLTFTDPPAFDVEAHAPDAKNVVRVRGRFSTAQREADALINQGATGSVWCTPMRGVDLPRFGFECPMLPGDKEAWIEIVASRDDSGRNVSVDVLAERPEASHAEYRKPFMVLPPGRTDQALVQAINAFRVQAHLNPLRFSEAESALIQKLQKQAVEEQVALDDEINFQISKELLAGRAITEPVFWARQSLGVAYQGEAGDWLATRLAQPTSRKLLMDADADVIALAGYTDPQVGFGASVAVYSLFDTTESQRFTQGLVKAIDGARGKLPTVRLDVPPELQAAAERIAAGGDAESALHGALRVLNLKSKRYCQGYVFDLPLSDHDGALLAPIVHAPDLHYGVLISHSKRPQDEWHHGVLLFWFEAERPSGDNEDETL